MVDIDLGSIHLDHGHHVSREDGMCLMEAVAFVAGEPHTDHPQCVCPVLAEFGRAWNDDLNDKDRQRLLKPFIGRLIGTRSTPAVERKRAFMAVDWLIREATPTWLRAAGLDAGSLEALPPLTSAEACHEAMPTIRRAREAAHTAGAPGGIVVFGARIDAADAVKDAGMAAAVDAVVLAAGTPVGVTKVTTAAVHIALAAAVDAARATAGAGAVGADALRPHVERLQGSALDLFHRMVVVGR